MSIVWAPAGVLFLVAIGIVIALLVASEVAFDTRRGAATTRGPRTSNNHDTGVGVRSRRDGRRRPF